MSSILGSSIVNSFVIPSALLIIGTAIIQPTWLPFAVGISVTIGSLRVFSAFFPGGLVQSLDKTDFRNFPLIEKTIISSNTAIYRFALPSNKHILDLPIGQHISVAAIISGQPKQVVRSYTPISSGDTPGHFDLLIKTYPGGLISQHVGQLKIGEEISVRGPKGIMTYSPGLATNIGMIAGGTGITPMLQIIRAVIKGRPRNKGQDTSKINLVYANERLEDILLKEDLDRLAAEDDMFDVYYVLSHPPSSGWSGGSGYVTEQIIKAHLPSPAPDSKIMICGPPPMVAAMKKSTEELGFEKARPVSRLEDQVFCF